MRTQRDAYATITQNTMKRSIYRVVIVGLVIVAPSLTVSCESHAPVRVQDEEVDSRSSEDDSDSDSTAAITITAEDEPMDTVVKPF